MHCLHNIQIKSYYLLISNHDKTQKTRLNNCITYRSRMVKPYIGNLYENGADPDGGKRIDSKVD